ncbi:MAG: hypothetical protein AB7P14_18400 [Blastocatellales bacterium]
MHARSKLKPGQKGTRKLVELYGSLLACVRYRYDEQLGKHYKTIELIVKESDWVPPADLIAEPVIVGLRVGLNEGGIQRFIKQAGGKWNLQKQVWELLSDQAIALGLADRIVNQSVSTNRRQQSNSNLNSQVSTNRR